MLEREDIFECLSDEVIDFLTYRLVVKFHQITKKQLKQAATVMKNFGNFLMRKNYASEEEGSMIVEFAKQEYRDLPAVKICTTPLLSLLRTRMAYTQGIRQLQICFQEPRSNSLLRSE